MFAYDGKHKIADRWEDHPYVVISQLITDIPVYNISRGHWVGLPIGTKIQSPVPVPSPKLWYSKCERIHVRTSSPYHQRIALHYFVIGTAGTMTQKQKVEIFTGCIKKRKKNTTACDIIHCAARFVIKLVYKICSTHLNFEHLSIYQNHTTV